MLLHCREGAFSMWKPFTPKTNTLFLISVKTLMSTAIKGNVPLEMTLQHAYSEYISIIY